MFNLVIGFLLEGNPINYVLKSDLTEQELDYLLSLDGFVLGGMAVGEEQTHENNEKYIYNLLYDKDGRFRATNDDGVLGIPQDEMVGQIRNGASFIVLYELG